VISSSYFFAKDNPENCLPSLLHRILFRTFNLALAAIWLAVASYGQAIAPVIAVDHGPNAPQQLSKPYVILVSLDGFRYDYAQKYHAKHLLALAAQGANAPEGMLPAYPSITFPNHYTIITGLYPGHHGIVANKFYDPSRKEVYNYREPNSAVDGTWYGGTPLWVLAEQQGMRSASFFWAGSEAQIQGVRPSYYLKFEKSFPNSKRVEQVLAWLHLPPKQRPHFITLYFSDTDTAGHQYGPDSPQVSDAVRELDREIGRLVNGIKESKLPVDLIVLADHGMAKVKGPAIYLDRYGLSLDSLAPIIGSILYPRSENYAEKAYETLLGKSSKFVVYRRAKPPVALHLPNNPRAGDPVVVPTGPYFISVHGESQKPENPPVGMHGFDANKVPEMKALFLAAGPDIRHGVVLKPFENVNVYPLIAKILGLDIANLKTGPIDGKLSVLEGILTTRPRRTTLSQSGTKGKRRFARDAAQAQNDASMDIECELGDYYSLQSRKH
jgi:predicted AlkP superfamily pyrophosphatase or phosphodiesterase